MSDGPIEIVCGEFTNTIVGSINPCSNQIEYTYYGYNVTLWQAILFVALFGLASIAHLIQGIATRQWFMLCTVFICAITELLGWSGRLWSNRSTEWLPEFGGYWYSNRNAFLMQISTLIFAPAFLAAGWYITLGKLVKGLGPQYCRFAPKTYSIFFVCGDVLSILIQAAGGGIASGAATSEDADVGARIMVGGVIVQMAVMVLYSILLAEIVYRFLAKRPVKPFRFRKTQPPSHINDSDLAPGSIRKGKILIAAMVFSTVLIFIRSVYRTIELLDGWDGPIISNEALFVGLDALMVFLAVAVFNVVHPGNYLPKHDLTHSGDGEEKHLGPDSVPMSHQSSGTLHA